MLRLSSSGSESLATGRMVSQYTLLRKIYTVDGRTKFREGPWHLRVAAVSGARRERLSEAVRELPRLLTDERGRTHALSIPPPSAYFFGSISTRAFGSTCPPNPLRMAESTFSANV